MYGFGGVGLSEVQISISELSVVGGWWVGGRDERTSWSDLVGVRQKLGLSSLISSTSTFIFTLTLTLQVMQYLYNGSAEELPVQARDILELMAAANFFQVLLNINFNSILIFSFLIFILNIVFFFSILMLNHVSPTT